MKQIDAAGGVLYRDGKEGPEVLLIFRRGVWDLPKGKRDTGESMRECAIREVAEEVGSSLPQIHAKLAETFHSYQDDGEKIGKTTQWFVMSTEDEAASLKPERGEGIERLQWMPLQKAKSKVGYDNLLQVLQRFEEWYYLS